MELDMYIIFNRRTYVLKCYTCVWCIGADVRVTVAWYAMLSR